MKRETERERESHRQRPSATSKKEGEEEDGKKERVKNWTIGLKDCISFSYRHTLLDSYTHSSLTHTAEAASNLFSSLSFSLFLLSSFVRQPSKTGTCLVTALLAFHQTWLQVTPKVHQMSFTHLNTLRYILLPKSWPGKWRLS